MGAVALSVAFIAWLGFRLIRKRMQQNQELELAKLNPPQQNMLGIGEDDMDPFHMNDSRIKDPYVGWDDNFPPSAGKGKYFRPARGGKEY